MVHWLPPVLEAMRELFDLSKPTFASCWGFQALAKAIGGDVVTDMSRAELGTVEVFLTEQGLADPLSPRWVIGFSHRWGIRIAWSDCLPAPSDWPPVRKWKIRHFASRASRSTAPSFIQNWIVEALVQRVRAYPKYVESITGDTIDAFAAKCLETKETNQLLRRFMALSFVASVLLRSQG